LTTLSVANGQTNLASYQYTLGASGNRTSVTENTGRTVNYTYDDLYRLTSETIANSANNGQINYQFDAVGNRLQRNSNVNLIANQTSSYDANDRLNSDVFDNNGSTKVTNGKSYNYDFENKLTSTSDGITIVYDGDGNRVSKTVNGVTTKYLVDTNNLTGYSQVVEELQGGAVVKTYTYGLDLISQKTGAIVSFYNYDGHGSVRNLTNAVGSVTDTYDYDAFGTIINRTGTTANNYLYAGEQFDADLGFYYNRARYLNVETGRFISQDSYEGNSTDPLSLHKYIYANADGINKIDPSGKFSLVQALIVVSVGMIVATMSSCTSFYQLLNDSRKISLNWQINNWAIAIRRNDSLLDSNEIDDIKRITKEIITKAFTGYEVTISEGETGNRMYIKNFYDANVGGFTQLPGATYSDIYYDSLKEKADDYAKERSIDDRKQIINGMGRAIGNTIAHEFLHQLNALASHNSTDRMSYDYHAFDRWEQFYGEDFHWSPTAKAELDKRLLIKK
jgi:RHS repeat-associated protein